MHKHGSKHSKSSSPPRHNRGGSGGSQDDTTSAKANTSHHPRRRPRRPSSHSPQRNSPAGRQAPAIHRETRARSHSPQRQASPSPHRRHWHQGAIGDLEQDQLARAVQGTQCDSGYANFLVNNVRRTAEANRRQSSMTRFLLSSETELPMPPPQTRKKQNKPSGRIPFENTTEHFNLHEASQTKA